MKFSDSSNLLFTSHCSELEILIFQKFHCLRRIFQFCNIVIEFINMQMKENSSVKIYSKLFTYKFQIENSKESFCKIIWIFFYRKRWFYKEHIARTFSINSFCKKWKCKCNGKFQKIFQLIAIKFYLTVSLSLAVALWGMKWEFG